MSRISRPQITPDHRVLAPEFKLANDLTRDPAGQSTDNPCDKIANPLPHQIFIAVAAVTAMVTDGSRAHQNFD